MWNTKFFSEYFPALGYRGIPGQLMPYEMHNLYCKVFWIMPYNIMPEFRCRWPSRKQAQSSHPVCSEKIFNTETKKTAMQLKKSGAYRWYLNFNQGDIMVDKKKKNHSPPWEDLPICSPPTKMLTRKKTEVQCPPWYIYFLLWTLIYFYLFRQRHATFSLRLCRIRMF